MSGINLILGTALDYERTHQLAIYALLKESIKFSFFLSGLQSNEILWEPEKQLFDLGIAKDNYKIYLEIKLRSSLTVNQIKRQKSFLENAKYQVIYVLLGTSGFEYSNESIINLTANYGIRVGYSELLEALNKLIDEPGESCDVHELALSYRNNIHNQYQNILNAYKSNKKDKLFYYSLYSEFQNKINNIKTDISIFNKGAAVYNLCAQDWDQYPVIIHGTMTNVYYEISNDKLCIKLYCPDMKDDNKKESIRQVVRNAVHYILDNRYKILDKGRIATYMSACQIEHDFSDINNIDKSVDIFKDIYAKMQLIYSKINELQKT